MAVRVYGEGHPNAGLGLSHWAEVYRCYLGDRVKAMDMAEQASRMIPSYKDTDYSTFVTVRSRYVSSLRQMSPESAPPVLEEISQATQAHYAPPHIMLASRTFWRGYTAFHRGDHDQAMDLIDQAAEQLRMLGLDDHHLWGPLRKMRAERLILDQRYAEAESLLHLSVHSHMVQAEKTAPPAGPSMSPCLRHWLRCKFSKVREAKLGGLSNATMRWLQWMI